MRKIYTIGVMLTSMLVLAQAAHSQSRLLRLLNPKMGQSYKCSHVGIQKIRNGKFKKKLIAAINKAHTLKIVTASIKDDNKTNSPVESELKFHSTIYVYDTVATIAAVPMPKPIYFRFDTDELTYDDLMEILLAVHHAKSGKSIILEGHTDFKGSEEYNLSLSEKRAKKIKAMMIDLGVKPEVISITGYGESRPATVNGTDEQRQLNRRVEFIVMNE